MMQEFWQDRPVLVTGATGLLGGWLVKRLLEAGADVVCLVRDWVPQSELIHAGWIQQVKVARGDVRDMELIERVLGEFEIKTVFHLAAQTIVSIANNNPLSTFDTNIRGTWQLMEACRRSPLVEQVLLASSDKAYGECATLPYKEDTPLQGQHPYDVSKSCADLIAQTYAKTYDLPVCVTRCGNFFGGGDLNWNRLIPGTIRAISRGQAPVLRSNGKYIRDYIYIEDGAAAYMMLAEQMARDPHLWGQAFNFSNENQYTVLDIVERILARMGSHLSPLILDSARHEIPNQSLCAAKARRALGWRPLFTLDEGLDATIAWYRDYLEEANTPLRPVSWDVSGQSFAAQAM